MTKPTTLPLNDRQAAILQLVADGHTNDEIATKLHFSPRTIKGDLEATRNLLGAKTTPHAIALAYEAGLLPADGPIAPIAVAAGLAHIANALGYRLIRREGA